jgi:RNA polymerase sigma-70 factor (ECF subfamily)
VAGGDPATFQALHDAHAAALRGYAMGLTRDPARADDIVQETLLRAWRSSVGDGSPAAVRAWLFTVARHLAVDEYRSARHRREVVADVLPEVAVADRTDAVFESMEIVAALRGISAEHREVIVKAYYGRLTIGELAADLGIPAGTVKSRLHYGLRALRLALQERGVTR